MSQQNEKLQKAFQRKCPNCGAPLRFDPSSGKLFCSHCKGLVDIAQNHDVREREFAEMADFAHWSEGEVSCYRCQNCGASSVLPRTTLATNCAFCGSPVVVDEYSTGLVRPDSLIPFELTEDEAATQLVAWRKRKFFAPNKFRKKVKANSIKGVYIPAWTFDAETYSHYSGRLGRHETRTIRRNGKTYTETYTHWFHVDGEISSSYDDIFIRGNNNIAPKYFDELRVNDKSKYVVYSDKYLAGYIADNYTVEPMDAYAMARQKIDRDIHDRIMRKHHADVEGHLDIKTTVTSRSFKYMLLPVYVATTKYGGQVYNQYVSGCWSNTVKKKASVCGHSPKSIWKILFVSLLGAAALVGLGYLIFRLMFSGNGEWYFDFDFLLRQLLA